LNFAFRDGNTPSWFGLIDFGRSRRWRRRVSWFRRGGCFAVHPNNRLQICRGRIATSTSEREQNDEMRDGDESDVPPEARVS